MKTKAQFLEQILSINPKYDAELIGKAYDKGRALHEGQLRKSASLTLSIPSMSPSSWRSWAWMTLL